MAAGIQNETVRNDWEACIDRIRQSRAFYTPPAEPPLPPDERGLRRRGPTRRSSNAARMERATGRVPLPPLLSVRPVGPRALRVGWEVAEEGEWAPFKGRGLQMLCPVVGFRLQLSKWLIEFDHIRNKYRESWVPPSVFVLPKIVSNDGSRGRMYQTVAHTVPSGLREWAVESLQPDTLYRLRMCAYNVHGESGWSEEVTVETNKVWEGPPKGGAVPESWLCKLLNSDMLKKVGATALTLSLTLKTHTLNHTLFHTLTDTLTRARTLILET